MQFTTKATFMTGADNCQTDQTTYIMAINPEKQGRNVVGSLRKSLESMRCCNDSEESIYGTTIPQIEHILRKVLEYEGRKLGTIVSVYLRPKEQKRFRREGPQRWIMSVIGRIRVIWK